MRAMREDRPAPPRALIVAPIISKTGATAPDTRFQPGNPGRKELPEELYADRATVVVALRLEGYSYAEIQERTGLTVTQIRYACRKARAAGKLQDVLQLVDNEAVPQAVENLVDKLRAGDWEATRETLRGRGVFRNFSHNKNEGTPGVTLPNLNIEIVNPSGGALPTVIVNTDRGAVVGTERED